MKYLLAAINAKYIHSNPGIRSLALYAKKHVPGARVGTAEYTINQRPEQILRDLYEKKADVVGFSCYIWNISLVRRLARDLKQIRPDVRIWLGGPEVSYDAARTLVKLPEIDLIMKGEGEETFRRLLEIDREAEISGAPAQEAGESRAAEGNAAGRAAFRRQEAYRALAGIAWRDAEGKVCETGMPALLPMDELPFLYEDPETSDRPILYYESSRGCPFSCSYCLSSIEKTVRFRSLSLVKRELSLLLSRRVPQVKFVDRTFNCDAGRAAEIWRFLAKKDNGVTNFHFEIAADLLDEEALALIGTLRPGLIQLEIGVQTTHPRTLAEIRRKTDLAKLADRTARIRSYGNTHQHLDLIAGLPYEDLECFRRSFNAVYAMRPHQLQLGFLKVLKGSYMEEKAEEYGLLYQSEPPYEVLGTRWLDYGDLLRLKAVEEMVEIYYNSGQFRLTIERAVSREDAFGFFEELSRAYGRRFPDGAAASRLDRFELLFSFLKEREPEAKEEYRDRLMCDLYLRENAKSRPSFARDPAAIRERARAFFCREAVSPRYLCGYGNPEARQLARAAHLEELADGSAALVDYRSREPLYGNAVLIRIPREELEEPGGQ